MPILSENRYDKAFNPAHLCRSARSISNGTSGRHDMRLTAARRNSSLGLWPGHWFAFQVGCAISIRPCQRRKIASECLPWQIRPPFTFFLHQSFNRSFIIPSFIIQSSFMSFSVSVEVQGSGEVQVSGKVRFSSEVRNSFLRNPAKVPIHHLILQPNIRVGRCQQTPCRFLKSHIRWAKISSKTA